LGHKQRVQPLSDNRLLFLLFVDGGRGIGGGGGGNGSGRVGLERLLVTRELLRHQSEDGGDSKRGRKGKEKAYHISEGAEESGEDGLPEELAKGTGSQAASED